MDASTYLKDVGFLEEYISWFGSWGKELGSIRVASLPISYGFFCTEILVW